jgi:hypothetical protein
MQLHFSDNFHVDSVLSSTVVDWVICGERSKTKGKTELTDKYIYAYPNNSGAFLPSSLINSETNEFIEMLKHVTTFSLQLSTKYFSLR